MKIKTTEAVRRFNAQTELVDLALDGAADDMIDPGKLFALLHLTGHDELKRSFEEAMRQVCISGTGWPTAAAPADPPPPALMPAINHTKSEDACRHGTCVENDAQDKERYAWKCADCGYVYGKESSHASVIDRLEDSVRRREGSNYHGITQLDKLIDQALVELKRITNWREFCADSDRPGDVANVILERDSMRVALKQSRSALIACVKSMKDAQFITLEKTLSAAMDRIDSIIPRSEV